MATARERIKEILKQQKRPLASAELQLLLPEFKAGNIYTTTSMMIMKYKDLCKNKDGKFYLPEWDAQEPAPPDPIPREVIEAAIDAATLKDDVPIVTPPVTPPPPLTYANTALRDVPPGKIAFIKERVRKHKVYWTDAERTNLAVATYELRRDKLLTTDVAFDTAQRQTLPPDRRRKITQWGDQVYSWLLPMLDAIARVKPVVVTAPPAPVAAPQQAVEQPQVPTPQPAQNFSSNTLEQVLEPWAKWLKAVLTEAFVDAMSRQMTPAAVPDKEQPAANEPAAPAPKHNPEMPVSNKVKKPRIVVYGLHNKLRHDIERDFRNHYDLRWGDPDAPGLRVKQVCSDADMVIAMRHHIPHSLTETMKRENVSPLLLSGTVTALRETLEQLKDKP